MKDEIKSIYKDIEQYDHKVVKIGGWVKSVRASKDFAFLDFSDGTCFKSAQVILKNTLENYDVVSKLNTGSTVIVEGEVHLTPENKQPFEIVATKVDVFCATDSTYPLQKKRHSVEFLREIAYLRPRTNLFGAVFRIRSVAAMAVHTYFQEHGYVYVNTPLLTTADCEGSDQMFKVTTLDLNNLPKTADGAIPKHMPMSFG